MITESERKELRTLFQGCYADEVLEILAIRKITNKNKKPFTAQYVRMVFQGARKNLQIEAAIWQLALLKKQELEDKELQKNQIIKKIV